MAASNQSGPIYAYGSLGAINSSWAGSNANVPDPEQPGPSAFYQGAGLPDVRYWFNKDQAQGYVGKFPIHYMSPVLRSINQIPAAVSASNIAAAQGVTSGTPMTLASANATGITINVPYVPYSQGGITQGTVQTAPIMLDFQFAFGSVTSGSAQVQVDNSTLYEVGMPLVIAGAGNAAGTVPLLTNVASIVDTTHITIQNAPAATVNPAAIGTGNLWGPSETWSTLTNMTPTAYQPWWAKGPGLFLDPRQAIARSVQIVGASGGTGGTFTVRAIDVYFQPVTMTITVGAGASTGYGLKAVKGILSVTPNFTDTTHNYTVGTSDVFGINYRAGLWEEIEVCWAGLAMTSSTGYTASLSLITASSATTGDVRGTIQVSATGGGSGIGATTSNGTVSSLAMTGNRLMIQQNPTVYSAVATTPNTPAELFGVAQF